MGVRVGQRPVCLGQCLVEPIGVEEPPERQRGGPGQQAPAQQRPVDAAHIDQLRAQPALHARRAHPGGAQAIELHIGRQCQEARALRMLLANRLPATPLERLPSGSGC